MCTVHTPKGKSTRTSTSLMEPYVWYYSFWHFVFMEPKVTVFKREGGAGSDREPKHALWLRPVNIKLDNPYHLYLSVNEKNNSQNEHHALLKRLEFKTVPILENAKEANICEVR